MSDSDGVLRPFPETIGTSGELVSLVPLLLGFRPVDSLVLVAHTADHSLAGILRVDLPAPEDRSSLLAQLGDVAVTAGLPAVTVVILGGGNTEVEHQVPHRPLLHALTTALHTVDITVDHAVWASTPDAGGRWFCYDPCRCSGVIPPMDASPVAAHLVMTGATTLDSRDALAATLAADPAHQLEHRAAMLDTRLRSQTGRPSDPATAYRIVRDAIATAATDPALPTLTDVQIVDLAAALAAPHVQDRCLADTLPTPPAGTGPSPSREHALAAERLWTVLTRAVPAPARAEPAFLLAVHAHLRGNGILAGIALDIARTADPQHLKSHLLHLALTRGMPPTALRHLLQKWRTELTDH